MGRTANGSDLGQWGVSSSNNQQWTLTTVGSARTATVQDTSSPRQIIEPTNNQVLVYPNPFTSSFNMIVDKPGEVKLITIIDITGRRVQVIKRSAVSNLMSIGASLKAGTYVVQVEGVNWMKTYKIVKMD